MDSSIAHVFEAVRQVVHENQIYFNEVDVVNHNHGDHLLEIFDQVVQTLHDLPPGDLAGSMMAAGLAIKKLEGNESARIYADGLIAFAQKLQQYGIEQAELIQFVREKTGVGRFGEGKEEVQAVDEIAVQDNRSGQVLKALVDGLSTWKQLDSGQSAKGKNLDMGALFELGIIYLQARQRGGSHIEVLSDAAVSASPLSQSKHRTISGKFAIQALLKALAAFEPGDTIT